jgi:type I restriction enzyme R subunit
MQSKKDLSERDICTKYITPAIKAAGWSVKHQVREEVSFTAGRIIVRGQQYTRGKRKRADYILYYKPNIPIAIIEAKDNKHSIGSGMQQALEYSAILDIPFVFSSNGDGFIFHDKSNQAGAVEQEISLEQFPSPQQLWTWFKSFKDIQDERTEEVVSQDYHVDERGLTPRYYQQIAINRTVEAIAKGKDRALLVMATGTGKTYTAFQIIYRLWKAGSKKRILYLADRNILISQAKNGDFKGFGQDIMTIVKHRKVDKSYQMYFALYQGLTGNEDWKNVYKQFSREFFDMVVIDECHRGSASEASAWREILDYFHTATHLGMTATPKETKDVSNIAYFGEPVFTYSLKQGIEDGFLAPYKVIRLSMDIDEGYRPESGKTDKYGNVIDDRIYNTKDFDRSLVIDDRTKKVAKRITQYLQQTDPYAKTIVFCIDTEHAERMRMALVNENAELVSSHSNAIVRITGDDEIGQHEIDNFIDVEERFPIIATTSKLLTTGVDTKMVKLVVLDANIGSMTEFKQIIGRGTRIREEDGKVFFSIMDFRKATNLFADPDFDGPPIQIYEPGPEDPPTPPPEDPPGGDDEHLPPQQPEPPIDGGGDIDDSPRKFYVNDVPVHVIHERVQYYGSDGKLITESLIDYTRKNIRDQYSSLDAFLSSWNLTQKKQVLIDELAEHGVLWEALVDEVKKDLDPFDLVCHVAFDQPALTRQERANDVRKRHFWAKYGEKAQKVIEALLDKYENEGIISIESNEVLKVQPLNTLGTPVELVRAFGSKRDFEDAIKELEKELYQTA